MKWIIERWQKVVPYLGKLWLTTAFLLVAGLSFEAGLLQKGLKESEPVIITVPGTVLPATLPEKQPANKVSPATPQPMTSAPGTTLAPVPADCAFVGSKKSNKYHAPTSRCAKQIKPENRLCFSSVEAAAAKGYIAGCLE